jgi:hypothetical protein
MNRSIPFRSHISGSVHAMEEYLLIPNISVSEYEQRSDLWPPFIHRLCRVAVLHGYTIKLKLFSDLGTVKMKTPETR